MLTKTIQDTYILWKEQAVSDPDLRAELTAMAGDEARIEDAFYRNLAFGTGGLRGVIGAGTNRMNVYTVAKASQGLANYVLSTHTAQNNRESAAPRIAISFDSRIKSDLFSQIAAGVFAANGIDVFIYPELMPTPCLSYAVRALRCDAGIMVTASHNPSKYNGYKVYGPDGCQITTEAAAAILKEIEALDPFRDVKQISFEEGLSNAGRKDTAAGSIEYIGEDVYTAFIEEVKKQSLLGDTPVSRDDAIVYTPLNGTGLKPVLRALRESGYSNITVVKEQEQPDGHFPTCPYPNPEIREAMQLGIEYAARTGADLLLATDPDCDRVGIAVRAPKTEGVAAASSDGSEAVSPEDYILLSGNETGVLLLDYVCSRRQALGTMPEDPVFVKTIVTTDMAERIAEHYGVRTVNVLTGFKYIGEQIGLLEKAGHADSYILGFEESYGYLSGNYVRDKDAVDGAFLICEMFSYYKSQGISLPEKLAELYRTYGYSLNTLHSTEFDGSEGFRKMQSIMQGFRGESAPTAFGGLAIERALDYATGIDGLPTSDVLKYFLEGGTSVVVRPSGTEPKLKVYISVSAPNKAAAEASEQAIYTDLAARFA